MLSNTNRFRCRIRRGGRFSMVMCLVASTSVLVLALMYPSSVSGFVRFNNASGMLRVSLG